MRFGVIADIHGNLPALRAIVGTLDRQGVDLYVCLGDLVGYGPFPNECVERVAELGTVCVAGNHDLIALGRLSDARCIELARHSLGWTREQLRDDVVDYLAGLPIQTRIDGLTLAHGSLDDPQAYITRVEQAAEQLAQLAEDGRGAATLLVGHTHRAWAATPTRAVKPRLDRPLRLASASCWLLNPGAVGQSRERLPLARCMVLDTDAAEARFHAKPYDIREYERSARAAGLPPGSYHFPTSTLARARRKLRRIATRRQQP